MAQTPKRILEEVLPLRIIREVEKWPVIYTKHNPEMSNPHFKNKVWGEVAKNIIENFDLYSATEKQAKVTSLIKKWRNLRDTFKRQLTVEKKNREGHNIKKREYVYFKHMSYLLPHMAEDEEPAPAPRDVTTTRRRRAHRAPSPPPPPPPPDPLPATEYIDEDKHFLLSLLPSFKRMNEDEKLTAKMDILKVIRDIKNSSMALDTLVVGDNLAFDESDPQAGEPSLVVKKELLPVELMEYKLSDDAGSTDSD